MSGHEGLPEAAELRSLLDLVERLDADNEALRQRLLEVMEWVEAAVSDSVRAERETEVWRQQATNLRTEIDAIHSTTGWRLAAPARALLARRRERTAPQPPPQTEDQPDPGSIPIFIPVRDRLQPLLLLIDWLERAGHDEIWLIDNASTFPPLQEFLNETQHHVIRLDRNLGHRSPFLSGTVQRIAVGRHFVISDPDVVPDEGCPVDALDRFRDLLDRHPEIDKVGFGLRVDDLPDDYPLVDDVRAWEARFWTQEVEPGVYRADIDTTFALYRPLDRRHREDRALRTGAPYVARHTPWYVGPDDVSDEDRWYREHADTWTANWDRSELPRWKRRWLDTNEARAEHGADPAW